MARRPDRTAGQRVGADATSSRPRQRRVTATDSPWQAGRDWRPSRISPLFAGLLLGSRGNVGRRRLACPIRRRAGLVRGRTDRTIQAEVLEMRSTSRRSLITLDVIFSVAGRETHGLPSCRSTATLLARHEIHDALGTSTHARPLAGLARPLCHERTGSSESRKCRYSRPQSRRTTWTACIHADEGAHGSTSRSRQSRPHLGARPLPAQHHADHDRAV